MNGWQRLGVFASVIWLVGMWVYIGAAQDRQWWRDWRFGYELCRYKPHDAVKKLAHLNACSVQGREFADRRCCNGMSAERQSSTSWPSWFYWRNHQQINTAILPIPAWWLAAYICLWLGRWVMRADPLE